MYCTPPNERESIALGAVVRLVEVAASNGEDGLPALHELDAPVPDYSSRKIRALRGRYKLSQAVLASVLNTSLSTVRQ